MSLGGLCLRRVDCGNPIRSFWVQLEDWVSWHSYLNPTTTNEVRNTIKHVFVIVWLCVWYFLIKWEVDIYRSLTCVIYFVDKNLQPLPSYPDTRSFVPCVCFTRDTHRGEKQTSVKYPKSRVFLWVVSGHQSVSTFQSLESNPSGSSDLKDPDSWSLKSSMCLFLRSLVVPLGKITKILIVRRVFIPI